MVGLASIYLTLSKYLSVTSQLTVACEQQTHFGHHTMPLPKHEERCVTTLKRLRKIILKSSKKFVACNDPYSLPCQRVESQNDMHSSLPFPFIKQHFDGVHDEPLEPAAVCCVCIVQRYFKHQTRPTPLVFNSSHDALLFINKQIPFLDFATL